MTASATSQGPLTLSSLDVALNVTQILAGGLNLRSLYLSFPVNSCQLYKIKSSIHKKSVIGYKQISLIIQFY